jgi:hypothetical protein
MLRCDCPEPGIIALCSVAAFAIRTILSGRSVGPIDELWHATRSRSHGAVQAVSMAMQKLGLETLIASRPSPERDRVHAMVAARVLTLLPNQRSRAGDTRRRLPKSTAWRRRMTRTCIQRWTGCFCARNRSRKGSLLDGRDEIGVRAGNVVHMYQVGRHFALIIEETGFAGAHHSCACSATTSSGTCAS